MKIIHSLLNNNVTEHWKHLFYKNKARYTVKIYRLFHKNKSNLTKVSHT